MARITAAQRRALPASDFALGKGHYPIDTENRARNALARGSQNASPSELSRIRAKVHAKYPGIKQQAGAHHDDEAQDRKLIASMLRQHNRGLVRPQAGAHHGDKWADQRWFNMPSHSRTNISQSNREERRDHQAGSHQAGARMQGNTMHPRMHALSKASATHLLNMGHINKATHAKILGASAGALGAPPAMAGGPAAQFGSLAPPAPAPMGMQAGARGHKYPKYGAGHYMSTPAPVGAEEGGGMGGGGQAGARKRKW